MSYHCQKCDMAVKDIECAKCASTCSHEHIDHEGQQIAVCKCGSCNGMIKSPQCCGEDMQHRQGS
jgi:hypothetical protein